MNILWKYQYPDWVFKAHGGTLPQAYAANLLSRDINAIMETWDWDTIIWRKVRQLVFNLQKRIYKAAKSGRFKKAKSLMYLLQNSTCGALLAVRKVTTDNIGKKTAGVDLSIAKTPKQKMALVKEVLDTIRTGWDKYKPLPAKRVMIPKANGKLRPLGIPTIKDRAVQAFTKLAMEPYYEAKFESASYGFRPGMGCLDAIDKITAVLLKKQKWVLDADIKGFFDNIDHDFIAKQIDTHWRPIVKQWLKAGYMFENAFHRTDMGTPQGGTISPLLANIALDQLETDLINHLRGIKGWKSRIGSSTINTAINKKSKKTYRCRMHLKLDVIRYADDFVIIHEDKEVIEESKRFIETWLITRGLTLSQEKTRIVHSTKGFDFLGHHIRHYKNRIKGTYKLKLLNGSKTEQNRANATHVLRVEPTKDKIKAHWKEISDAIWKVKSATPDRVIRIIQPKITGWANYYKTCHSDEAFGKLDYLLYQRLYQWAQRRHPRKGKRWVAEKYFSYHDGRKWTFYDEKTGSYLKPYGKHRERTGSYARVGFDRSFYDGDTAYWAGRLASGYGDITPSKAKMLNKQEGMCPVCKSCLTNEDLLEAHHKVHRAKGGENKYSNLVLMHRHCHDKVHKDDKNLNKHRNNQPGVEFTNEWGAKVWGF